jgi:hypothetical protein
MCGSFLHAFYAPALRVNDPTQKQLLQIQGLLSLCFRYKLKACTDTPSITEGPEQHEFCASHNSEQMTYTQGGAASSKLQQP